MGGLRSLSRRRTISRTLVHGYAHKSQTRERSDIPASVGREGVVPEGLIGRMDRGRQLAARLGRGLVKADGQRRPRCRRAVFLRARAHPSGLRGADRHQARAKFFTPCRKNTQRRSEGGPRYSPPAEDDVGRTSVIIVGWRRWRACTGRVCVGVGVAEWVVVAVKNRYTTSAGALRPQTWRSWPAEKPRTPCSSPV